jgi:hypothetical protein
LVADLGMMALVKKAAGHYIQLSGARAVDERAIQRRQVLKAVRPEFVGRHAV